MNKLSKAMTRPYFSNLLWNWRKVCYALPQAVDEDGHGGKPYAFKYSLPAELTIQLNYVVHILTEQVHKRFTVDDLAEMAGLSTSYFSKLFRTYTGSSPMAYAETVRIREACRLLQKTDRSITEIAYELGYSSSQNFATVFRRYTNHTPSNWRLKENEIRHFQ